MINAEDLYNRVGMTLRYFSDEVKNWIHDYYFSDEEQKLLIILEKHAEREIFCNMLIATGKVSPEDEIRVKFIG